MAETEAHKAWTKANTQFVGIRLNNNLDADIIRKLKDQPSIQGYIKALIREDIKKAGR